MTPTPNRKKKPAASHLQRLADLSSDAILEVSTTGAIFSVNIAVCRLLGYGRSSLLKRSWKDLLVTPSPARKGARGRLPLAGTTGLRKITLRHRNGTSVSLQGRTRRLPNGHMLLALRKIADAKRGASRRIMPSPHREPSTENRYRVMVESATEPVIVQTEWKFAYVNNAATRFYGASSADELLGKSVLDRVHPDYRDLIRERMQRTNEQRLPTTPARIVYLRLDGTPVTAEATSAPITFDGKPGSVVFVRDIENRLNVERLVRESEERLRRAQAVAHVGNWELDLRALSMWGSEEAVRIYGLPLTDAPLPLATVQESVLPEFRQFMDTALRELITLEKPYDLEFRIRRHDNGQERWLHSRAEVLRDAAGAPAKVIGVVQDVTDRKLVQDALEESEYFLRKSQSVARVGSYYVDIATGRWVSSPILDEVFGISPEYTRDVEGWLGIVDPEQREEMGRYFAQYVLEGRNRFDKVYKIKRIDDGQVRWVHGFGELEFDQQGNTVKMVGTIQDVTEHTRYEMAIVEALREKEILLKEIHHRVKNNMQVISSLLNLQRDKIPDPAIKSALSDSQNRIRSMALVHERLYHANNLASIDFADYLKTVTSELALSFHRNDVAVQIEADSMQVSVDVAIPCGLIANELISNAFKHGFPGGRGGKITIDLHGQSKDRIALRVRDDGVGIPPDGEIHRGETLGMSIIQTLTSQISGSFTINRAQGTEVTVEFPGVYPGTTTPSTGD
jgi:PAS domain S-box-containing protein